MNALDHVIVFLTGPADVDVLFPEPGALVLDAGTRHAGQGTANRRVLFANCYLELLWVDSRADAKASGLHFLERCRGDGFPFGCVFRGGVPDAPGLVDDTVPDGPALKIRDDPAEPFLAVLPSTLSGRRQSGVSSSDTLQHADFRTPVPPPDIDVPSTSFSSGPAQLTVVTQRTTLVLRPTLSSAGRREWCTPASR